MFECPTDDWTCPYYKNGSCTLDKPYEDCSDFIDFSGEFDWEDEE